MKILHCLCATTALVAGLPLYFTGCSVEPLTPSFGDGGAPPGPTGTGTGAGTNPSPQPTSPPVGLPDGGVRSTKAYVRIWATGAGAEYHFRQSNELPFGAPFSQAKGWDMCVAGASEPLFAPKGELASVGLPTSYAEVDPTSTISIGSGFCSQGNWLPVPLLNVKGGHFYTIMVDHELNGSTGNPVAKKTYLFEDAVEPPPPDRSLMRVINGSLTFLPRFPSYDGPAQFVNAYTRLSLWVAANQELTTEELAFEKIAYKGVGTGIVAGGNATSIAGYREITTAGRLAGLRLRLEGLAETSSPQQPRIFSTAATIALPTDPQAPPRAPTSWRSFTVLYRGTGSRNGAPGERFVVMTACRDDEPRILGQAPRATSGERCVVTREIQR